MLSWTEQVFNRHNVHDSGPSSVVRRRLLHLGQIVLLPVPSAFVLPASHFPIARAMAASATGAMSAYPRSLGCKPSSE